MKKDFFFIAFLAFLMPLTVSVLSGLNEGRIDVYLSLFTLEYFIGVAVFRPRRRVFDFLGIALFILFIYFVTIRVMSIIYGK